MITVHSFCWLINADVHVDVSLKERSCVAFLKVDRHRSNRLCASLCGSVNRYSNSRGSEWVEERSRSPSDWSKYSGARIEIKSCKPCPPSAPVRCPMCVNDLLRDRAQIEHALRTNTGKGKERSLQKTGSRMKNWTEDGKEKTDKRRSTQNGTHTTAAERKKDNRL